MPPVRRTGEPIDAASRADLYRPWPATSAGLRLTLVDAPQDPGVILTWQHMLADARGIQELLAALPDGSLPPPEDPAARWCGPRTWAQRGRLAQRVLPLLRPLRSTAHWRPAQTGAPQPLVWQHLHFDAAQTSQIDAHQRRLTGRFQTTAFQLAILAHTLARLRPAATRFRFPLAVDLRHSTSPWLANAHGLMMLACTEDPDQPDRTSRELARAQKAWLAAEGPEAFLAAASFLPWVPEPLWRRELGERRSGVAGSCICACPGTSPFGPTWAGRHILAVEHLATIPAEPGLAVLFHRYQDRQSISLIATPSVARSLPLADLAEGLRRRFLPTPD